MRRLTTVLIGVLLTLTFGPARPALGGDLEPRQGGDQPTCVVGGSAAEYAPRLAELGAAGKPVVTAADDGYWGGRGFRFLYERSDKEAFLTERRGGYLAGGVVIAADSRAAQSDLLEAFNGWLKDWDQPGMVEGAAIGEQSLVARRKTPWEIVPGQPMVEVLIAFRVCNASVHMLTATRPDFDPVDVARAYARGVERRLVAMATAIPAAQPTGSAAVQRCSIEGDLAQYAPSLRDFGPGGGAFAVQGSYDYWEGRGYSFGFERASGDAYESSPWGGYLFGGVLRADSEAGAVEDLRRAAAGWTQTWSPVAISRLAAEQIGDESVVLSRLTPWEINSQQPMVELYVGFRRCNLNVHYILTVMPQFEPLEQALRYADLIDQRLAGAEAADLERRSTRGQRRMPLGPVAGPQ